MPLPVKRIASLPVQFLQATGTILVDWKLLSLCIIPNLIGIVCFFLFLGLAFGYREEVASLLVSDPESWLHLIVAWLIFFINVFVSGIVAIICAITLGAFFIESFIERVLKQHNIGLPEHASLVSFAKSILRGLRDDAIRVVYVGIFMIVMLICGLFPLLYFIPPVIAALLVGYSLLDLPLALMEIRFKDRWGIAKAHLLEVLALGALFSLILLIPLGGILFLPVAYHVAIQRLAQWGISPRESS